MMTHDEAALESAARALVDAIEVNQDPRTLFEMLVRLLGCAAHVEGVPPRAPAPAVAPVTWTLAGTDPLRRAADRVYRADSSVEVRVRELHALVAPHVLTGEMRALAWDLAHAWGDVATSLVRPLWELGYG
jgi:hypothetical protein